MNGGRLVAEVLRRHRVSSMFTLCGGHISPILIGAKQLGIRVIDTRDERNAVFAADAMARLTGIPGVAAVTAGPGVTNTVTAVQSARLAESPVLVLGGATATVLKGRGALQDVEQLPLMRAVTKFATAATTVRGLVEAVEKALRIAVEGTPGPVFVEAPVDLLYDEATVREWYAKEAGMGKSKDLGNRAVTAYLQAHLWRQFAGAADLAPADPPPVVVPEAVDRHVRAVADRLRGASKPVLVIGSQTMQVASEADRIAAAVRGLGVPTFLGGTARGLLGKNDPLQLRHSRGKALKEADVVLVLGFPLDFRLGYGQRINKKATLVTVNRDKAQLGKNRRPTIGVEGDAGRFLQALARELGQQDGRWSGWLGELRSADDVRDAEIAAMATQEVEHLNPVALCQAIEAALPDHATLVVDGGDFVATAAYVIRPRAPLSWLDPGVFGTLGVGGGFAVAAKAAAPQREVWLLYGDGSAPYSLAEIDTCVRHGLPVIAVIGTNGSWAQIAREQVEMFGDDVGTVLRRTAYHTVAEGYGGVGMVIDRGSDVPAVLAEARRIANEGRPVVINAMITDTEFRKGSISM